MREKAHALRRNGQSINSIVRTLRVPKSTLSYWCRDIKLSPEQIKKLVKRQADQGRVGMLRAAENKRLRRIAATAVSSELGRNDVGRVSERDHFILGLALYWGEGYKRGNEECGLTNSDQSIIRAFIHWAKVSYKIPSTDLILRVTINAVHRRRRGEIEQYWSKITGVPLSQFTSPSFIVAGRKTLRDPEKYFGTLRVKVRRGTSLRRRIIGSIEEIKEQVTR